MAKDTKDIQSAAYDFRDAHKPKPKKLSHLEIKKAENGGHIVEHHFDNKTTGEYREPETHVFSKDDGYKMLAHVANNMDVPEPTGGADEDATA